MAILKIEPQIVNSSGDFTFNSAVVTANVSAGNVLASAFYWANGAPFASSSFGNADVAAYLDSYYTYANANAATQATAIDSINANLGAYQTYANANVSSTYGEITSLWSNAASQQTQITTLDANLGTATTNITSLQANAAFQANLIDILTGNAATQGSVLDILVANAAAQSANLTSLLSNAAAQEASLTSLVNNAAAQSSAIDTINANIGAYQTYANTTTYANANVAAYLTATYPITNDGALRIGTGSGPDVYIDALNNIYVGHGTANHSTLTVAGDLSATGNATFSASTLISGSGNLTINNTSNITVKTGAGLHLQSGATFVGDAGTFVGNLSAANVAASGFYWANGTPFVSSTYGNTDVAAYLLVDSTITGLQANAAFQANLLDVLSGNAASQGSLLDVLVANAAVQAANLTILLSNAAAQEASLTSLVSNAAVQSSAIDTINANVGAYQVYANANATTQATSIDNINANLGAYQTYANTAVNTINANLGSYQTWANLSFTTLTSNAATQATSIDTINANVAAANAAIITANTAMKNYVDDQFTAAGGYGNTQVAAFIEPYQIYANANAATQATSINAINANLGAYQIYANANAATLTTTISTLDANVGAYQIYANANAAAQATSIDTINANVGAYQIYANANAATQATAINTLNANVGAYEIYANAQLALRAPLASPTFTGDAVMANLTVGNLVIQGNTTTIGSTDLTINDSIINLHTFANLAPLTSDDGRDIGLAMHYYKGADGIAFVGWANDSGYLEYYAAGTEVSNVFVGSAYGTVKAGEFLSVNNTPSTSTTTGAIRVTGGIGVQGNIFAGAIYTDVYKFANGTPILDNVYASITGANAAIVTANTGLKSYVDAQDTAITNAWTSNAATQATSIDTINANVGAYQVYANANAVAQTTAIDALNANIIATNAAIITANTGMKSYVDAQFTAGGGYGNTQVGAYLTTYGGNVYAGNIVATGNIVGGGVRTTTSASAPLSPTVGDIWYSTTDNTTLRYTYDGSSSFWLDIGGPTSAANAIPLGSTVESYLTASPTISAINANVTAANAAIVTANSAMAANVTAANAAIVTANSAVVSYVNSLNSAMSANVAAANSAIITANTALKSYVDTQDGLNAPLASPTFTGTVTAPIVSITGNATISGNILQQQAYYETYGNITNTGGNLTCNFNLGSVFYVTSLTANVTASFTNVNALTNTVTATTLIIDQGATAYRISNIQVNGTNQTIRWIGNVVHTGTASNTDIVSFSLIHLGSGTYRVLGQSSSYG